MSNPVLAQIVREVLAEELARLGKTKRGTAEAGASREITVAVADDKDLQDLVRRIIALCEQPEELQRLKSGKIVFRLSGMKTGQTTADAPPAASGAAAHIENGLLTERQVDRLAPGTKTVVLGKAVRTTPLARDRLRQRGISIERMER
jgi:hypothetical protein